VTDGDLPTEDPSEGASDPTDGGGIGESQVENVDQGSTGLPESLPVEDTEVNDDANWQSLDSDEVTRLSSRRTSTGWSPSWYTNTGHLRAQAASGDVAASEGDPGMAGTAQVESVEPEPEIRDSAGTEAPIGTIGGDESGDGEVRDAAPDVDGIRDGESGSTEEEAQVEQDVGREVHVGPYISFRNRGNPLG